MGLRAGYETSSGGFEWFPEEKDLTLEQASFLTMTQMVGMPRLDLRTADEFLRRVDLFQTYMAPLYVGPSGPMKVERETVFRILQGNVGAWTNVQPVSREVFDREIEKEMRTQAPYVNENGEVDA